MAEQRPPENGIQNGSTAQDQNLWEETVEAVFRGAPSWLFSVSIHVAMLILLALIFFPEVREKIIELNATTYDKQEGEQLDFRSPEIGQELENPSITQKNLPPVDDPLAAPPIPTIEQTDSPISISKERLDIGLSLEGRTRGSRNMLGKIFGASATTEAAVNGGLAWLAKNQKRNGSWSLKGPYSDGVDFKDGNENREAATAMAMLAFQGAGHTHLSETKYSKNVERGLKWLLKQQNSSGCLFKSGSRNARFYTHAQATIVICELYAMENDSKLRKPAELAIQYLLASQNEDGGWRYIPKGQMSDVSVTGWVVMALQSARMGGLDVPKSCLERVSRFLDSTASEGGSRYGYLSSYAPTRSMTAEGLLCRQYLGWKHDDDRLRRGVEYLSLPENLINYRTSRGAGVYYWYYATQVMHHMGGNAWERWNNVMRVEVPGRQIQKGSEKGSWDPQGDRYTSAGGRLYVTCLSIYMLEVYYRHLPLYREAWHP